MPPDLPQQLILDFEAVLSPPRFATYVRGCDGNRSRAMALYCWNTEIAAAFYTPLQFAEIAVRNAAIEAIVLEFGTDWHASPGFQFTLPTRVGHMRPRADLQNLASRHRTTGAVAAELKFAFWQQLFVRAQDLRLWDRHLRDIFPGIPRNLTVAEAREQIHGYLQMIRSLRNRIAHHEPIISRDLAADLAAATKLIKWRRPSVAAWIGSIETVTGLLANRP